MSAGAPKEFDFTDRDFDRLCVMVNEHTGIHLTDAKRELVYGRLARRLRALGLGNFSEYCDLIGSGDDAELQSFTNAITTNLTSFFRERHHFDYLQHEFLPGLIRERGEQRRLRIWSAGCSTGEEPYSIAMTLMDGIPAIANWDVQILATDLDSEVLATARAGIYAEERVKELSAAQRSRYLLSGRGHDEGGVRVRDTVRSLLTFQQLNLMSAWPMRGPFDAIFCRNVIIYFTRDSQRRLIDRYAEVLREGGYLFVGHSESLFKVSDRFELQGKTVYRRIA